ncbi:MAG TPA: energy transducer TonB [Cyclobacteriaceae bacterium]
METKKTQQADLERKSPLFFSVGLVITMSMVVYAFDRKSYTSEAIMGERTVNVFENVIDVPVTEQEPPLPPVVKQIQFVEIRNDDDMNDDILPLLDINSLATTKMDDVIVESNPEAIEETDVPVDYAEESAAPKDGIAAFYKYVGEKIKYPAQARRMGIEGRVFVSFVIGKDGSVSEVKATKGIGAGCDEEAVRIIQSAPAWKPGRHGGRTVKQRMVLPITFRLGS